MRRVRRLALVAVLALAACSRTTPPPAAEEEADPAERVTAFAIATGERRYELHARAEGSLRLGGVFAGAIGAPVPPTPGASERELAYKLDVTARLRARIESEGDSRRVTMSYESVLGEVAVAGVVQNLTAEELVAVRGPGGAGFSFLLSPEGSVSDMRDAAGNAVPPGTVSGAFGCPDLPPGGAAPSQEWKAMEPVPFAGLGGFMVATNGYTLEGDNSAVVSSRIDGPLDAPTDPAVLASRFPPLAGVFTAAPAGWHTTGDATVTSACELTWPEQELLAITTDGRWDLSITVAGAGGPPELASVGPGEVLRVELSTRSELRSV